MEHPDIIVQNVCSADLKKNVDCFDFCKRMSYVKNLAMLFHVDMIYLAKQAKRGDEKSFVDENRNQIEPGTGFLSLMSKRRKYTNVLPVLAQDKRILHMACT